MAWYEENYKDKCEEIFNSNMSTDDKYKKIWNYSNDARAKCNHYKWSYDTDKNYYQDIKKEEKYVPFKRTVLPLILTAGIALGIIGGSFFGKKVRPEKSTVTTYCQNDDSYKEEEVEGSFYDGVYLKVCTPYLESEDGYVRTVTTYEFKDVSLADLSDYLKLDSSFYKNNKNPSFKPHQSNPSFEPHQPKQITEVEYKDKLEEDDMYEENLVLVQKYEEDKLSTVFALVSKASIPVIVVYELMFYGASIPISIITSIRALKERIEVKEKIKSCANTMADTKIKFELAEKEYEYCIKLREEITRQMKLLEAARKEVLARGTLCDEVLEETIKKRDTSDQQTYGLEIEIGEDYDEGKSRTLRR